MTLEDQINLELACKSAPRPREIITNTDAEFQAVCERQARGEIAIESLSRGEGNAQWRFAVRYCV